MKGKKILSCLVSAALCLSVAVIPAAAASFPDVAEGGAWAVPYIEDVVKKGYFVGIEGKFVPNKLISNSEVLALSARIAVDKETRNEIYADRATELTRLMGKDQDYFHKEFATCLEAGIVSYGELKELYQSGSLLKPITKENFALYMVRAMQLEPMARNLSGYTLDFSDVNAITPALKPYIYILTQYSVLSGNEQKQIQPQMAMNRAMAAKMLSVTTDIIEENGISTELAAYTDYDWVSGKIISAVTGSRDDIALKIKGEFGEAQTFTIPDWVPIYKNSMLTTAGQLKAGEYARVNLDDEGEPFEVRLGGSVTAQTGSVVGINDESVLLSTGSGTKTIGYDRFTQVQVGARVGDYTLIDTDTTYAAAICYLDQLGHMVALQLSGGTHTEEGILLGAEETDEGLQIQVTGFEGRTYSYTLDEDGAVTADGKGVSLGTFGTHYKGEYVSLRVLNDEDTVATAVAVDTDATYVQGAVRAVKMMNGSYTVSVQSVEDDVTTAYDVTDETVYFYEGEEVSYEDVKKEWFVTARIEDDVLTGLWGYPGSRVVEGEALITYPLGTAQIVLSVTEVGGGVESFSFDISGKDTMPDVTRDGERVTIDKIRGGDMVRVTVRYNIVSTVEATTQKANVAGTITKVEQTTEGVTITLRLDEGGTESYKVGLDATVTRDKKLISMYDLRVEEHVAMVTSSGGVASIEVDKLADNNQRITGTVFMPPVNGMTRNFTFRVDDGVTGAPPITVVVPGNVSIQDVSGGNNSIITPSKLKTGDVLDIYGAYVDGQFVATLVIRK